MLEVNGAVNMARRSNRLAKPWLEAVLNSPIASEESKVQAQNGLKLIKDFDSLLTRGYVSTGYQYDDEDPRNQRDAIEPIEDNEAARTGSNAAEEAEAEIAFAIAQKRAGEAMEAVEAYFAEQPIETIHPEFITDEDGEKYLNEYFTPLRDWISDGRDGLMMSMEDADERD
jgi:hypothetical protein